MYIRICEYCVLRRTALTIFKGSTHSSHWNSIVKENNNIDLQVQCFDSNNADEIFMSNCDSNIVFALLLLHDVDQNSTVRSKSSSSLLISKVKREFATVMETSNNDLVNGDAFPVSDILLPTEQRWLVPIGTVFPSDHPIVTRAALLCVLSKTLGDVPNESNDIKSTETFSSTSSVDSVGLNDQVTNLNSISFSSSSFTKRLELITEFFLSEWKTSQINLEPTVTRLSLQTPLMHRHGIKKLWRQLTDSHTQCSR